jgi:hypothetical protein
VVRLEIGYRKTRLKRPRPIRSSGRRSIWRYCCRTHLDIQEVGHGEEEFDLRSRPSQDIFSLCIFSLKKVSPSAPVRDSGRGRPAGLLIRHGSYPVNLALMASASSW